MPDRFCSVEDRAIHKAITADVKTALRLQEDFETRYPNKPEYAWERMRHRPQPEDLYPQTMKNRGRVEWLVALLEELARAQRQDAKHASVLEFMLSAAWKDVGPIGEAEFLKLAEFAEQLVTDYTYGLIVYIGGIAEIVTAMEKAASLSTPVVSVIRDTLFPRCVEHKFGWWDFAWPLFRSEYGFLASDISWVARVRRDVNELARKGNQEWLPIFDSNLTDKMAGAGKPTQLALTAVKSLGRPSLDRGLRRWIAMLRDNPGAPLSELGVIVLQHLILLCEHVDGKLCDELLFEIARVPWSRAGELAWIETFVYVAGKRPEDRAFVGIEALAMNPVTATDEVQRKYEALMRTFGAQVKAEKGTGVDGYPLNVDPELAEAQRRINRVLVRGAEAVSQGRYVHPTVKSHLEAAKSLSPNERTPAVKMWLDHIGAPQRWFEMSPETRATIQSVEDAIISESKAEPWRLHAALTKRWDWIQAHKKDLGNDTVDVWRQAFFGFGCGQGLVPRALAQIDTLPVEWVVPAIRAGGAFDRIMSLCRKQVEEHGWSPELAQAFKDWIPTIGTSRTDQDYRAKAEWFLWFEDVLRVDETACWSHRVKRDLRMMTKKQREQWRSLIDNPSFTIREAPTKHWLKAAPAKYQKIGAAEFRKRFAAWFAAFAQDEKLRLTVTGRNILRVLIWYALIAEDPAVDRALGGFASAQWKTKENARCASQAEMAFSYVLAQRSPKQAAKVLGDWVQHGRAPLGSASRRIYEGLRIFPSKDEPEQRRKNIGS